MAPTSSSFTDQVAGRPRRRHRRHSSPTPPVQLEESRFKLFNEPDSNYHGLRWAHDLPEALAPIAFALRVRTVPLRNLGACIAPDNSWIFLQGIETLPVRMARHSENALTVAEFLSRHPQGGLGALPRSQG